MALTDLTKKILDDAGARADDIRASGKSSVAAVHKEAQESLSTLRATFEAETKDLLAADAFRAHERTEHEVRLTRETARRRVLDEAFTQALEETCSADDATYRSQIEPALQTLAQEGAALTAIYAPEARCALTEAVAGDCGINAPVVARNDIRGGFVAEGTDASYDMRFEQLIETVRRSHEPAIARLLFPA